LKPNPERVYYEELKNKPTHLFLGGKTTQKTIKEKALYTFLFKFNPFGVYKTSIEP